MADSIAIRLGCAIWAYKDWVGDLYPPGTPARKFLHAYGEQLRAVEGNATFYAVPRAETLQQWRERVPAGFHFCPKFPQAISHQGPLLPHLAAALAFVELLQANLGDRLGPLLLQLPPSYGADAAHWQDLTAFLTGLGDIRMALEVRHFGWFAPATSDALRNFLQARNLGRAILDTRPIYRCPDDPQLTSERRKPNLPVQPTVTADFTLLRFISHPERDRNLPYWEEWSDLLIDWQRAGKTIYAFMHCPDETRSPANLRAFYACLQQRGASADFTPWQEHQSPPQQLSLFNLG